MQLKQYQKQIELTFICDTSFRCKKADKLYRQAVNSVGVIKSQHDSDPKYKREIDAKVLEKLKNYLIKKLKEIFTKSRRIGKSIRIELSAGSKGIVPKV